MDQEKYICWGCVEDSYINSQIKKTGSTEDRCSYCKSRKKTIPISDLVEPMNRVLRLFYQVRGDSELYPGYSLGSPAEDIIADELGVDENIPEDIHMALQETYNDYYDEYWGEYSENYVYNRTDFTSALLEEKWDDVKNSLQSESRFFNSHVKIFFEKIFSELDTLKTVDGRNAVTFIDSNTTIFRARKFETCAEVKQALQHPEKHFGPPPHNKATSGRMNAQGIPVFYGATNPDIAIAEVRPAVGNYVVVAKFTPLKRLRILEMSALDGLVQVSGSLFDPDVEEKMSTAAFLRKLSRKLTVPVSGNSDNEYLITQAVAEYLSVVCQLDGLSIKSTQQTEQENKDSNPLNIILFSKKPFIKDADLKGNQYEVNLFSYDYDEYQPYSYLEPEIEKIKNSSKISSPGKDRSSKLEDYAMQLDITGLVFYKIKGVKFQTQDYHIRFIDS